MKVPNIISVNLRQLVTAGCKRKPKERVVINDLYTPVGIELYGAKDVLENYAKAKNIKIKFFSDINDKNEDILRVYVSDKKGKFVKHIMNGDVADISVIERTRKVMLEDKDGCNYIAKGIETHEQSFIQRVYRAVECLTYSLLSGKK